MKIGTRVVFIKKYLIAEYLDIVNMEYLQLYIIAIDIDRPF